MGLGRQTLSGLRDIAGSLVKGIWVDGGDTAFTTIVSVQPLDAREMNMLPEGRRTSQAFKLYGQDQLVTVNKSAGTNPDILTINGDNFEVLSSEPWQSNIRNHYKSVVVKI